MGRLVDDIRALPPDSRFFSLEFFPPKTNEGFANLIPRLHRLVRLGPLFATVTWGAGGSTASRSLELAEYLQVQLGLNTCLHLTCTNMRRRALDDALDACHSLGIRNLLALRGDEPRDGEYDLPDAAGSHAVADADEPPFRYAVDLVRHIRQRYGDYFCIGVAAYPEGHADSPYDTDSRSPERDLPHLAEKTQAGADFIMTQLFYDSKAYLSFERMLRDHPSKAFDGVPLIPGLMPVQSWAVLSRTTRLACATVPPPIMNVFEADKGDDAKVKARGVDLLSDIVTQLGSAGGQATSGTRALAQGFHFYTLNLEKAVAQILDRCQLTRVHDSQLNSAAAEPQVNGTNGTLSPAKAAVKPKPPSIDQSASGPEVSKMDTLSISEGQGGVGREATWDDYPNGRWGDARSPAYGSIDGYGPSLHVSPAEALRLWGSPTSMSDIGKLFSEYLNGKLAAIPWSEESLSEETNLIRDKLLQLSEKSWWSVASQPAVDAARSDDKIHGWGPATGGWVWQKPFVEIFVPSADWTVLKRKLQEQGDEVSYFAGNSAGAFESSDDKGVNPVTWGAFKGKEIITPTQIDALSFRAWQEEAHALWREWQRIYPPDSASARLLHAIRTDVWLVNIVGHVFQDGGEKFWQCLLE